MILYPCRWMRAGSDGEIYCEKPRPAGEDVICDTDLLHPEYCDYYKPDQDNGIDSDEINGGSSNG